MALLRTGRVEKVTVRKLSSPVATAASCCFVGARNIYGGKSGVRPFDLYIFCLFLSIRIEINQAVSSVLLTRSRGLTKAQGTIFHFVPIHTIPTEICLFNQYTISRRSDDPNPTRSDPVETSHPTLSSIDHVTRSCIPRYQPSIGRIQDPLRLIIADRILISHLTEK